MFVFSLSSLVLFMRSIKIWLSCRISNFKFLIFFNFGTLTYNPIELLEVNGFSNKVISLGSGITIGLKRESIEKNNVWTVFFLFFSQANKRANERMSKRSRNWVAWTNRWKLNTFWNSSPFIASRFVYTWIDFYASTCCFSESQYLLILKSLHSTQLSNHLFVSESFEFKLRSNFYLYMLF